MQAYFSDAVTGDWALFLSCAMAFPFPEDLPLLYAGVRVASGQAGFYRCVVVATTGVLVRDVLVYALGRTFGEWLRARAGRWSGRFERGQRMIGRHGSKAVLLGRFAVGVRAPVFFAAGAMRVPFRRFVAWDVLGLAVAIPLTLVVGQLLGPKAIEAGFAAVRHMRLFTISAAVCCAAYLLWRMREKRRAIDLAVDDARRDG